MSGGRRILVYTPEPAAGAGQYVAEFVVALSAANEEVCLFCPANFSYEREVAASGVEIVRAPMRRINYASLWSRVSRNIVFAVASLKKFWVNVRRGEIVHFQFAQPLGLGLLFFWLAKLRGASTVLTVHDPFPHRWILPPACRWVETTFLSVGYSLCDRLIVHNQAGKRILTEQFHIPEEAVTVIPHGPLNVVNAARGERSVGAELEGARGLRLLLFGSLRENKGIHLAIAAIQRLRQTECELPVSLTIAGQAPNLRERPFWEGCKQLIATQPGGIEVIERIIEDEEISPLFARHDAVLLPYVDFFSDSGVAMLALAQGKAILATGAGGLKELLDAANCGFAIVSPTIEGVEAAIEEARRAPVGLLQEKGANGFEYALVARSWNSIGKQTSALYTSCVGGRHPKVVLHTPEPASSAALYVEALSKALAAEKIPITVVCPANHQAIRAMRKDPGIEVRTSCLRGIRTDVSLFVKVWENLRFVLSSVLTLARATKPRDIVHFQYILHLPFGLIFLACAWARRARIVFTVHDPLPHKFLFPAPLRWIEMTALRWAYQWSDVLIVHSEAGKRRLIDSFRIRPEKIHVIVHGPYELKKPVEICSESQRLEVLFFGSLRENKAPHLAIQAVQRLATEGVPIRLTVAGQVVNRKEEAYWASCRRLIDSQCESIRLLERFTPDEDLPELFSSCHCFVLPYTTFSSDSGVAYMAMANGKPILSTGAGGLGWLLEQSHGGIRISEASVEGVAAAMRLAHDLGADQLERMGRVGADWMLAHCGWSTVARETREVYSVWMSELKRRSSVAEPVGAAEQFTEAAR